MVRWPPCTVNGAPVDAQAYSHACSHWHQRTEGTGGSRWHTVAADRAKEERMKLDPEIEKALEQVGDRLIQSDLDTMEGIQAMRAEVNRIGELFNATLDRSGVVTESRVIPGPPD